MRTAAPTDFLAAITQHIPDKGAQMLRYYGWYSNKMRGQRQRMRGAAPGPVKRVRPFRTQQRTRKACLTPVRIKPKLAEDEPDAKAILPEPRSVKKANFYQ